MLVLICPDRALVTRSLSSCASSMMMTSWSGSTDDSPKASMASSAWLVTTISASAALFRAISAKHSVTSGQFAPRQSKALTDTCDQARSLTPGMRSSRSPVSVIFSQVRIRWISSPRPERSEGLRPASASAPRSKSMPSPSSGYPDEGEGMLFDLGADAEAGRKPSERSGLGEEIQRIRTWEKITDTGDRDDLMPGVSDRAWSQVSVNAFDCLGANCPLVTECFAEIARNKAAEADIVVTNHALLAIDAFGESSV